ncbi:hypothetical protein CC80DRAFT_390730, partial [Byssothecium circinans]
AGGDEATDAHEEANGAHDAPQEAASAQSQPSEEPAAENYEAQGETTLLEDAMTDSAKAPLLPEHESANDDWGASGEVFDLGGMPPDAPVETPLEAALDPMQTPHAEAVGTTVGDEVIGNNTVGGNTGDGFDWGNTGDHDFFGGATHQAQQSLKEGPGSTAGTDPLFDLEMDDDFLPDTDPAPTLELDLDDDEGFLEDEPAAPVQQPAQSTASRYAPQIAPAAPAPANAYGASGPQFTNFSQINQAAPAVAPATPYGAYGQPSPFQQQPTRPPMSSSSESFAAKAKGGYHSPYDLPDDVVTTRKRPVRTTSIPAAQPAPPPPRTSSISSTGAPRPPPSNISASSLSPPPSGHSAQPQMTGMPPTVTQKSAAARSPSSDFFAELPVTTKPKASPRYSPQQAAPQHPPPHGFPPKERTASWSSLRNEFRPDHDNLIPQLQKPEQPPMFPDQPTAPVRANSLPVPQAATAPPSNRYSPTPPSAPTANARYSPAPPTAPATHSKYSPAPPGPNAASAPPTGPPRPPVQPYAPRTSSPLAFHTSPQQQPSEQPAPTPEQHGAHTSSHHPMHSAEGVPRVPFKTPLEGVSETEEQAAALVSGPPRSGTPPLRSRPSSAVSSPRKKSNYTPQYQPNQPAGSSIVPPPRSQSQSPSAVMKHTIHRATYDRPASSHAFVPHASAFGLQPAVHPAAQNLNVIPSRRQVSHDYECIAPTDERAADPLQRWKGAPVFAWGFGGTVVTSFPKQIPRYGGGATVPMMKCSPGEVKIQNIKEAFPLSDDIATFPGPLKTKSKKKDVTAWLGTRIEALENQFKTPSVDQAMGAYDQKRLQERILLWKILQVLVENDGQLHGNPAAEAAVRKVLSPDAESSAEGEASFSTAADLVGITRSNTAPLQAETTDARALEELRTYLTKGDREKAVWHAVDQRLWAHAMLLSSTLNKDIWKQVVQEFVRKEVKNVGRDNQALAVLYEIFAGNHEDCIDELVPASARAGFQMVSTDGGSTQNALQGLDRWQETLSLVLNNRSEGDAAALLSLGRLLAGYGRVEAAHICFIFARGATIIGGADDPTADLVLIGADHRQYPLDLGVDLEPVLLTEVYEFGLSLSAQGGSHIVPHLQNYKLTHAYRLAEYGQCTDALAYCDAIAASMKASTRVSPYYNASFVSSLDDLSKRLSHSPKDGSSSWISKPSMDKVSSSLLSKFNSFIAGDDEKDAANTATGNDVGPFAGIAGDTPNLSPAQSSADLYGAYSGFGVCAFECFQYIRTEDFYRVKPRKIRPRRSPIIRFRRRHFGPSHPTLVKSASYSPLRTEHSASQSSYGNPYQPTPAAEQSAHAFGGGYQPLSASFDDTPPPSSYEPPTFEPYQEDADEDDKPKPKPKSFMDDDDDDDLATRAAALKGNSNKSKSDADRAADEAFRKAAEADAKRDKETKKSGSWFGGWFKKDPNAAPGPIKAKLGEESSFYYDPELKKWVNKKAGADAGASKPMATPPPPKSGPPSRSVSSNNTMGPPSSLPSGGATHLSAPPTRAPTSNPQRSSSMPPPMNGPNSRASTPGLPSDNEGSAGPKPPVLTRPSFPSASGPPSRPGTGMSTASSIDDLLGAPQARKGPGAKKKKAGRYVDVM